MQASSRKSSDRNVLRSVLGSGFRVPESERVFYAELHDSWVARLRRDLPEGRRIQRHRRVAPIEIVQQVERLQPELEIPRAAQRHDSRQRKVNSPETGAFDGIEAGI